MKKPLVYLSSSPGADLIRQSAARALAEMGYDPRPPANQESVFRQKGSMLGKEQEQSIRTLINSANTVVQILCDTHEGVPPRDIRDPDPLWQMRFAKTYAEECGKRIIYILVTNRSASQSLNADQASNTSLLGNDSLAAVNAAQKYVETICEGKNCYRARTTDEAIKLIRRKISRMWWNRLFLVCGIGIVGLMVVGGIASQLFQPEKSPDVATDTLDSELLMGDADVPVHELKESLRVCDLIEHQLGRYSVSTHMSDAVSLCRQADSLLLVGELTEARECYARAAVSVAAIGPDTARFPGVVSGGMTWPVRGKLISASALRDAGEVATARRNFWAADVFFSKSIELLRTMGPMHSSTLGSELTWLGKVKVELGEAAEGRALLDEAVMLARENHDKQAVVHRLNSRCAVEIATLDLLAAERSAEEALKLSRRFSESHQRASGIERSKTNLAFVKWQMGDTADAARLLEDVAESCLSRAARMPDPREAMDALQNLSSIQHERGEYVNAKKTLTLLKRMHDASALDTDFDRACVQSSLGVIAACRGDYSEAAKLIAEALPVYEASRGREDSFTIATVTSLAHSRYMQGRRNAALRLFEECVDVVKGTTLETSQIMRSALLGIAVCRASERNYDASLQTTERMWNIDNHQHNRFALFATEQEQLTMVDKLLSLRNSGLTLVTRHLPRDARGNQLGGGFILGTKGVVLDVLTRRHRLRSRANEFGVEQLFNELQEAVQSEYRVQLAAPQKERLIHSLLASEVKEKRERAEQALARGLGELMTLLEFKQPGLERVVEYLGDDSALVEFVRFEPREPSLSPLDGTREPAEYAAAIIRRSAGEPQVELVSLGNAQSLDGLIREWREKTLKYGGGPPSPESWYETAEALRSRVWDPLEGILRGCRNLYLSPDGELTFLPFGALVTKGGGRDSPRFLIEEYDIAYVASGRDLAAEIVSQGTSRRNEPLLVADPSFDAVTSRTPDGQEVLTAAGFLKQVPTGPVPGTLEEVQRIADVLQQRGYHPRVETGVTATESAVRSVAGPWILHLATHGFFLSAGPRPAQPQQRINSLFAQSMLRGPGSLVPIGTNSNSGQATAMVRSGICLAGAGTTIRNQQALGDNDGLLTAEEIAGSLNLQGTWLVVCSTCQSGLGSLKDGEGVFGLRRSLAMAGAQHLVITLSNVEDEAAVEIMTRFYEELDDDASPVTALLRAQRSWIESERNAGRFPHPCLWAPFIGSGRGPVLR